MSKVLAVLLSSFVATACGSKAEPAALTSPAPASPAPPAKKLVVPADPNNIVSIAVASQDHTTLVAALQAADYVAAVSNPGPLTVFAPTNAAFDKLPKGTVETLVKPEHVDQLKDIIKYHATTSVYSLDNLKDGQVLGMANGGHATVHIKEGKLMVNDAKVVASMRASNGIVHVIDTVLVPPAK